MLSYKSITFYFQNDYKMLALHYSNQNFFKYIYLRDSWNFIIASNYYAYSHF